MISFLPGVGEDEQPLLQAVVEVYHVGIAASGHPSLPLWRCRGGITTVERVGTASHYVE